MLALSRAKLDNKVRLNPGTRNSDQKTADGAVGQNVIWTTE